MPDDTTVPAARRPYDRRVVPWLLVVLLAVFGGAYVAVYLVTSDRIPRGTTVSGVEIGGLTPDAAEARLVDRLEPRAAAPIDVTAVDGTGSVTPLDAGLQLDVRATVDGAGGGRSWDPRRIWDYFTGGGRAEPVVRVDEDALAAAVRGVAERVDVPAVEGRVAFRGDRATPRYPTRGTVVDQPAAVDALRAAFLRDDGPVELPSTTAEPAIDKDAVSTAMDDFANPAMSGAVTVRLAGKQVRLDPEDYSSALSLQPDGDALQPALDGDALVKVLRARLRTTSLAPRDADVRLVGGRPRVIPARTGLSFDPADVQPFLEAVTAAEGERTLTLRGVAVQPDFTTADARRLKVVERVSSWTTNFPYAAYRNINLGRAAELVDGTLLKPGETFSLNGTVGERTAENGFTKGFIISNGVFKEDFGGGVSQVATTTFNAAFFAGLKDVEHKPHSFYIDRYPVGREATVAWPTVDLRFENTTPYGVLVQAWIDPSTPSTQGAMHVAMWSTKYWDITAEKSAPYRLTSPSTRRLSGPECVPNTGYGGFDIDVYRIFRKPGSDEVERRERMHTTYTPSDTVICS